MTKIKEFLELVKQNPELPIVPMVDGEIVGCDDYGYWLGCWGRSEITEYYLGKERVHFKDDDVEDVLNDMDGCEYGYDKNGRDIYELSDDEWYKTYDELPWIKCIVVYITT